MKDKTKAVWFLIIIHQAIKIQGSIDDFLVLVENVQEYYVTPRVYLVFDKHNDMLGREKERDILKIIKYYSKRNLMSHAITYEELVQTSDRRENALYVLVFYNMENIQHLIRITKNIDMSSRPWFLYIKTEEFDCNNPGENFFKLRMDTRMSVMCENTTTLKSYYGIYENQTEVFDLAEWIAKERKLEFKDPRKVMIEKTDMKGITLRLAKGGFNDDMDITIGKFYTELMDKLEDMCNFKTKVVAKDKELGYWSRKNDQWFGFMKTMQENKADIGLGDLSMSKSRMRVVDFAIPILEGKCFLYAKLPDDTQVLWDIYFQVFKKDVWATIAGSIFILSVIVCLMKNGFGHLIADSFSENLIIIWGIFNMQSPSEISTRSTPIRIVYFSMLVTALVLNATYAGSITSYITSLSPKLPFATYSEFLQDHSYEVIVIKGSRDQGLVLSNNSQISPLKYHLKNTEQLPIDAYRGFLQICKEKTAFYTNDVNYATVKSSLPCKIGALNMKQTEKMSFVMTKNSPYKKAFNYMLLRLSENGILTRMRKKYFPKYEEIPKLQPNVITLNEICPILIILVFGVVIAVFLLLIEIVWFDYTLRG